MYVRVGGKGDSAVNRHGSRRGGGASWEFTMQDKANTYNITHLEISGLVSVVFVDDVHLVILELTKTTEHNVTSAHPNL